MARPSLCSLVSLSAMYWFTLGCGGPLSGVCDQGEVAPGLTITIADAEGPADHPRPGDYSFTVTTELGAITWTCTIDAQDRSGAGCAADRDLRGKGGAQALLVSAVAGEDRFWLSLTLIEDDEWRGPEAVQVEVVRDEVLVADEQYAPSYVLSPYSGAEGCPRYFVAEGDAPTLDL